MRNTFKSRITSPALLVAYGLGLTFIVAYFSFTNISREEKLRFETETSKTIQLIRNRMAQYESALIQTRAFMETTDNLDEEKFGRYFTEIDLMNRYPGLQGLGYAPLLKKGSKLPDNLWPKGEREIYVPIRLLRPETDSNQKAVGFDMYSEEKRRNAMEEARLKNRPIATEKIRLVQESKYLQSSGFNVYLPLYLNKETLEVRGYIYSPFRFRILIQALDNVLDDDIAFSIYDSETSSADSLFYETPIQGSFGKFRAKRKLPITTRDYSIEFRSLKKFHEHSNYSSIYTVLIVGSIASILIGLIAWFQSREAHLIRTSELTARENKILTDAIENSLNGFDIINEEGKFIYVNKAYLAMWGYDSASEVLGTSPALHCADPQTPLQIISDLKTKKTCDIEFKARRKDGSLFDVRMLAYMAYDVDGKEIYPTTSIDISVQRATEERLKESVKSREEFLSVASHELKTPLTSLLLNVQLHQRSLSNQDGPEQKFTENVYLHIKRITKLVDDMLDVTRIQTGKLSLEKSTCDLGEITEYVLSRMEQQILAAKIQLPKVTATGSLKGNWDRIRLEQVLTNLFTNALKYGDEKPFTVSLTGSQNDVTIEVRDSGRGIALEAQKRIFDRFERAIESREISGLGLGLFIVKQIVESHKGEVWVESTPGQGAGFFVLLPK